VVVETRGSCAALTRDGKPCSARVRPGTAWCPWHAPDLAARRAEWSARGGTARSNASRAAKRLPDEALTPAELQGLVSRTMWQVISGELEVGVGNCVANLARSLIVIREATTTEDRLRELEQRAADTTILGRRA
jgi:hypothetical protein